MKSRKILTENGLFYLIIAAFSFVLLYFCTASSFRYETNPWNDANAFFTVGKAMFNGIVPYRDIFEQKGPLLYFIHGIAYLISNSTFTGVYIFEGISLFVFSVYIYKCSALYINKALSCIVSVATSCFVVNSFAFYCGDSAEEFILPTMSVGLYYILKYFKNSKCEQIKWYVFLICGFLAGCVAMIKFTLLGFWLGWMALLALHTLFARKEVANAFKFSFIFLLGMFLAIIPWIIYFAVKGALADFINVYFVINATAYANDNNIITRVLDLFYYYNVRFEQYPVVVSASTLSCLLPLVLKKFTDGKVFSRIAVPFMFVITTFFIYIGGVNYTYYYLPLTIYVFLPLVLLLGLIPEFKDEKIVLKICSVLISTLLVVLSVKTNPVVDNIAKKGETTFQNTVTDYIYSHNPEGKILNYGRLDTGVYLRNDYTNLFKHFEGQNIKYEEFTENIDEQNRYIDEHEAFYVVTTMPSDDLQKIYNRNQTLKEDYKLVMTVPYEIINQADIRETKEHYCFLFELDE